MEERQISINNLKVNYKIAGEGPAVLILHGWGGSSDSWKQVQHLLAEKKYRVIVPDFPGFGKSITPPEPWGIEEYTGFILKLSKELELNEFHLIGHSFGGRIAVRLIGERPEKVKSLILCASAGIKPKPGLKTLVIFCLAKIGNALFSSKHSARFKDGARNYFYSFLRKKDYVRAQGVMKETIKRVINEDLLPDLSGIKKKTLIIWGKNDKMVPLKYAHIFNEKISGSKLEIMPKVGHSPHLEEPEKLTALILKFLKEE
jgi:pimeloyl-ACP methyl ester carboxylesterase